MRKARVRFPVKSVMNKTEARYAREILEVRLLARDILWYKFECWKLTLGYKMSYSPDFVVVTSDGQIECHEVKAVWSTGKAGYIDDARVKIKTAAQVYPFLDFIVAAYRSPSRKHRRVGGWEFEQIPSRNDELPKSEAPSVD